MMKFDTFVVTFFHLKDVSICSQRLERLFTSSARQHGLLDILHQHRDIEHHSRPIP